MSEPAKQVASPLHEPASSPEGGGKRVTLGEAFASCEQITRNHYENFPVASRMLPKRLRPYVCAVYAFARTADDFADEKSFEGKRMELLTEYEARLQRFTQAASREPTPDDPIFIALAETIKKFDLPASLFSDLLTAFKMDVQINRYKTFQDVLGYCRYSANPVGRIILHLMGYPAPRFLEYSDCICTALQLANFWQDVPLDWKKGRVYIPLEDRERFRYSESELSQKIFNESFRRLILFEVERTQELFDQGRPLCGKIPGRFGFELKLTWLGGTTILKKIRRAKGNVFEHRPVLTKKDAVGLFWKAFWWKK